ncbi:unnamed protein product [Phytophthora fragariaefolia]|uniref:Unnamed protein product n=1 Tax=Phytophthora fragariaefolia TaxID=1490495 RepID=A0A9W6XC75_9STRA|nr:unnamed protein product [Phytophthora fragariaefolia]
MDQVNAWKAAETDISFNAYYGDNFRGAGLSDKNLCFLYAFQAACHGLGRTGLVNSDHWERFCLQENKSFPNGVLARDIDAFFNFIRKDGVPLDYLELFKKYQKKSMLSAAMMAKAVHDLPPGYYIVWVAQDLVEHCFTLVLRGPDDPVMVYDNYQEGKNPPCYLESLSHLQWLTKVCGLHRVALPPLNSPQKSKKKSHKKSRKKSRVTRN